VSIWTQIAADAGRLIAENPTAITIRRGSITLAAQTVRLEMAGRRSPADPRSDGGSQVENEMTILGDADLDIQRLDRFNDGSGVLYEVTFVHPNRLACVQARARVVE
jgi:hypothetical protein